MVTTGNRADERTWAPPRMRARWGPIGATVNLALTASLLQGLDRYVWLHGLALTPPGERNPLSYAYDVSRRADVVRISYNSPLELLMHIGIAGGIGLALTNRMIGTFNKIQEARVGKARADYEVAVYEALKENLLDELPEPGMRNWRTVKDAAKASARSLELLSTLELADDDAQ